MMPPLVPSTRASFNRSPFSSSQTIATSNSPRSLYDSPLVTPPNLADAAYTAPELAVRVAILIVLLGT
eukprot:CAMPEP_0196166352 /NCGR_PEP_ID=MMETSP0911-20130528/1914_1 /TAXON_ID=49265 /ORGANISM="Thalassiosira rotula, Strain GSO102" /LENGTH=67 /DNA_ID=CAMNT_0041431967 /DNA_START=286 /DNA_END=489 /DNA_ORIENTATION=+